MAFTLNVSLVDAFGRNAAKRYEIPENTYADALVDAGAIVTALQAVSDLGVVNWAITYTTVVNEAASAGSNVDVGATIRATLNNGKGYAIKIPGPDMALINPDGSVDMDNEDLDTYLALFDTGTGIATVSEGNTVATVKGGSLDK